MTWGRPLAPEELESIPTIELLSELKRRHHLLERQGARVAVLGPPCIGKRTQAEAFRRGFGICRISAADLLKQPEGGDQPAGSTDERAVSNLMAMLDQPQCRRGFVLEGFPSTVPQAQRLQEALGERNTALDGAVFLDAPEASLLERCRGRLFHGASGRIYHDKFKPPADDGVDDFTGDALARPPHTEEKFRQDCGTYQEGSGLLREFYKRAGLTREIDAAGPADDVAKACAEAIRKP
eukprot:CAMPEP_0179271786 /NCGR_PEP_ID=MMETSP0797-20121207/32161_1 /TAXON_ID=47934 /ORGANISM="Dinophysis acuminata, Strain DAEP01" /LENGTH=237 /DNA_ID=CAMNT_0020980161 /DNA_START=56 /DNA_END=769 /DNA_ORIENTATION=+